jgi:hypothetical protein
MVRIPFGETATRQQRHPGGLEEDRRDGGTHQKYAWHGRSAWYLHEFAHPAQIFTAFQQPVVRHARGDPVCTKLVNTLP